MKQLLVSALLGLLDIPFPDNCVVKVGGTSQWIDSNVAECYFAFKFQKDLANDIVKLELIGTYHVKIINLREQKYDMVGLSVQYDYQGDHNCLKVNYIEVDKDINQPMESFKQFLAWCKSQKLEVFI